MFVGFLMSINEHKDFMKL